MKLLRYGPKGKEKPGLLDEDGKIRDLSDVLPDWAGIALTSKSLAKVAKLKISKLPLVKGKPRIGSCVTDVRNFIAVGLNYADHACHADAA